MNGISNYHLREASFFERKTQSHLMQIVKGIFLLGFSQCAGLFAKGQIIRGGEAATAIARRAINQLSVINRIPDQVVAPSSVFYLSVNNTFTDEFNATLAATNDHSPLPSWLNFYPSAYSLYNPQGAYQSITIAGNLAITTVGPTGLFALGGMDIIDISSPGNPVSLSFSYGSMYDVAVQGNYAYAIETTALAVYNISNPASPFFVSQLTMSDTPTQIVVSGSHAYLPLYYTGLQIVDISNPNNPQNKGLFRTTGYSQGVALSGNLAYVAGQDLQIIDVSNSNNPLFVGIYNNANAEQITIVDQLAVVSNLNGIQIVDISVPQSPHLLGSYQSSALSLTGKVQAAGNSVYAADNSAGLRIFNITNPTKPGLAKTYAVSGQAYDVGVEGNNVFLVSYKGGFYTFNPFHPWGVFLGTPPADNAHGPTTIQVRASDASLNSVFDQFALYIDRPPILLSNVADQALKPGQTINFFIDSNTIFYDPDLDPLSLSASLAGNTTLPSWLSFVNIPLILGFYEGGSSASSLDVAGNYAYLSSPNAGLLIFDVSLPSNPTLVGTMSLNLNSYGTEVEGNRVYVRNSNSLYIIDVTNPTAPFQAGTYTFPDSIFGLDVIGNTAYAACQGSGLVIVNVTNPSAPTLLSSYAPSGIAAADVTIEGDLAYVTDTNNGLIILDVSNVHNPQLLGDYLISAYSGPTVVAKNKAYMNHVPSSVFIIDVSNPAAPASVGHIYGGFNFDFALQMNVVGELLYIASGNNWYIYNIAQSSNPLLVSSQSSANYIKVLNNLAYVLDENGFFQIYDLTKWKFTGTPGSQDAGNYEIALTAKDPAGLSVADSFTFKVEGSPQLVKPIANQLGSAGTPITFFIDQSCFKDPNGNTISYAAQLINATGGASPLPAWLSFSQSGIFTGIPSSTDAKQYTIQVTASNGIVPPTQSSTFNLTIAEVLDRQTTRVGAQFNYSLGVLVPQPQGPVTYTVRQSNGASLPAWLRFNGNSAAFSGVPQEADKGEVTILVTASDGVQPPTTISFTILVNENSAPVLENEISNQVANVKQKFRFVVPDNTFKDEDNDPLSYTATQVGGQPLPLWLNFDGKTFQGTPGRGDTGAFAPAIVPVKVTASDGSLQASTAFSISVQGTSNAELALSIVGPVTTVASFIWAWYKKRGVITNTMDKYKEKYRRPAQSVRVGSNYSYQIDVPAEDVVLVQCFKGKKVTFGITKPGCLKKLLTYDVSIPGGAMLPSWLEYDSNKNVLFSKRPPDNQDQGTYLIRVFTEAQIIENEFNLHVVDELGIVKIETTGVVTEGEKPRKKTIHPFEQTNDIDL